MIKKKKHAEQQLETAVAIFKFCFYHCMSKMQFTKYCFCTVRQKCKLSNTVGVAVLFVVCFSTAVSCYHLACGCVLSVRGVFCGVATDCLSDYLWEFAKLSWEKENKQKRTFPLREKNNGRNQTAGHFFPWLRSGCRDW